MSLPWIKVFADLPDHPRAEQLAILLEVDAAWHHLVAMWLWCSKYAAEGRVSGIGCERLIEKAARWKGQPGAFAEAAIATGWLCRDEEALVVVGWDKHQVAHLEKKERDRIRAAKNRAKRAASRTVARGTLDDSPEVREPSANGSRTVAGEKEKEKEIDPPPTPPTPTSDTTAGAPVPASVKTDVEAPEAVVDKGLGERRARRRWSGPATGEVARVWSAWLELVEPRAVWGDERGDLIQDWLRSGVTADRLIAAIEGYAGDPDWGRGDRRRLLTIEVALGSAAALERGWSMRGHRNWRDPRRPRAARPPARDAPPPLPPRLNGAVPAIEELGGMPEFLRAERERRARA